jgi:TIR domain
VHAEPAEDTTDARGFDAFISYSHAADERLAPALQTALQSIGEPWYRRRVLRVFRDTTSLSASPELWPSMERALERSRHFILFVSPDSAASPWVDQEVAWWRAHRESTTCLIALTAGELDRDERRADLSAESSVPPSLRGWFPSEPLWIDLRWAHDEDHLSLRNPTFRDAAATLAAPLLSADGAVAAAGEDGTMWLWTGLLWRDAEELESIVCPLVGGELTKAEWDRHASAIPYRNSCDR